MEFDPHRLYCRHRLDNGSSTAGEGLVNGPARGRLPPSLEDARIANRIVSAHQDHLRGHLGPATGSAPSAPCHSTQPAGKPDSVIRMGLRGSGLRDADLAVVVQKMESRLQTGVSAGGATYGVVLDLSCNPGISDSGIRAHVVPFIARWPERIALLKDGTLTKASPAPFRSSTAARTAETSGVDVGGKATTKEGLAKGATSTSAGTEASATAKARLARLTSSPAAGTEEEKSTSKAADKPAEARRRPSQPQQNQSEFSAQVQEDISSFLEGCAIFTKKDFDGRVRQHLHAILTKGGRRRVQEALDSVQDSVRELDKNQIKKPSAYLFRLLRIHLQAIESG